MRLKVSTGIIIFTALLMALPVLISVVPGRAAEQFITVEVQKGDTLWGIAQRYLKTPGLYKEILKYNNIKNPDLIKPGMKLKIPVRLLKKKPPGTSPKPVGPSGQPAGEAPASTGTAQIGPLGKIFHVARDAVRVSGAHADEVLRVGSALRTGDRVVTDSLSFFSVSLGEGNFVVGPDTRLMVVLLERMGEKKALKAYIKVISGFVRFDAPVGTDIRVRSEIAGVRANGAGFSFRVEEEGRNFVDVYSGRIEVISGDLRNVVGVGQGIVVDSEGVADGPLDLPPAPALVKQDVEAGGVLHHGARWDHVPGAASYRVEVALDSAFERPVYMAGYAGNSIDFNFLATYSAG